MKPGLLRRGLGILAFWLAAKVLVLSLTLLYAIVFLVLWFGRAPGIPLKTATQAAHRLKLNRLFRIHYWLL